MSAARGKYLVVNADDFGQSPGVNRGVIQAHERGVVTSASLMVRWPAAAEAAAYAGTHGSLGLGIHVDLGEWAYRGETWTPLYEVVPPGDGAAVEREVAGQLAAFRRLTGKNPTHIDSHQHVHQREPARAVLIEAARELGVPLRHFSPTHRYCGDFYGQTAEGEPFPDAITVEGLLKILAALPAGATELGCHPGYGNDLETMYRDERAQEVKVLCDPRVRRAISALGIELHTFARATVGDRASPPL
ncbi:MAG TPA: ChbG/HpnK family deacetylase [Candidatus Binatia bacterium]